MNDITIRMATVADAEALLNIYAPYVKETAITYEYEVPTLEDFSNRISNTLKFYPYLVAEKNGKIIGYAYGSKFHERRAYIWSAEYSIYLDMNERGNGIGELLYTSLEEILKRQNITNLYSCIAYTEVEDEYLTNASKRFHERMGFKLVGKYTGCANKFERWYDMIMMEKIIGDHSEKKEVIHY